MRIRGRPGELPLHNLVTVGECPGACFPEIRESHPLGHVSELECWGNINWSKARIMNGHCDWSWFVLFWIKRRLPSRAFSTSYDLVRLQQRDSVAGHASAWFGFRALSAPGGWLTNASLLQTPRRLRQTESQGFRHAKLWRPQIPSKIFLKGDGLVENGSLDVAFVFFCDSHPTYFGMSKLLVLRLPKKWTVSFAKTGWTGYLILGGLRANLDETTTTTTTTATTTTTTTTMTTSTTITTNKNNKNNNDRKLQQTDFDANMADIPDFDSKALQ